MGKVQRKYTPLFLSFLIWISVFFVQGQQVASAQHIIDSIKISLQNPKEDTNKVKKLNKLCGKLAIMGQYDSALVYANKIEALAEKIEYKQGVASALITIGNIYFEQGNYPKALEDEFKTVTITQEIGNKRGTAAALGNIGSIYFSLGNFPASLDYQLQSLAIDTAIGDKEGAAIQIGNIGSVYFQESDYPQALEYDFKALNLSKEIGDKEGIATNLGNIGSVYCVQGNYSKALEYYLLALQMEQETGGNKDAMANDMDNISNCYGKMNNYVKALEYAQKALALSEEIGDKDNVANELGNLGNLYLDRKDYPKAEDDFFKALTITRQIGDKAQSANLYTGIGNIYILQKDYSKASIFLDSARILSLNVGEKNVIQNVYRAFYTLDSTTGNYKNSFEDYKKYILYRDSITNKESVKKVTQLEVGYEFQKREDSIKVAQEKTDILKTAESNRKTIITWSAVVILLLTIILGLLFINRQQIKHRKDKIISEKEKNLLKLEKQRMENELTNATALLDEYIKNVVQKNTLLDQFKDEIEGLKKMKSKEIDENRIEHLEHLSKQTILTEDDWNKFKELFEQVHKGYFIRMREKLPDVTQAEMRLVCLTKLKLGTKEMAGILGVSFDTIRKSRYRLRKKLNLPEEDTIDVIAESI